MYFSYLKETITDYQYKKYLNEEKNITESVCAVDYAFKRIGGKYKGRILWYINKNEVLRFGELKKRITDITTKMLTQTLRELESDGLLSRKVYHEVPPKVEYRLTNVSRSLIPFITLLREWGVSQMEKENIPMREHEASKE